MKVSIIIPCYNNEKYVAEAIESAINQTYKNIEVVCINDGSTDNSANIIQNYADKYSNIVFINEENNKGVIYCRNKAIDMASGEYILPLDADDKIDSTYIEKAVPILTNNPNIGIVYCDTQLFGTINEHLRLKEFNKNDIIYENCICNCALFRKSDFLKAGKYKSYMTEGNEDHDLWLSFMELGLGAYKIKETLFFYRKYNETSRNDNAAEKLNSILKTLIKHHIDLYTNEPRFINRVFLDYVYKDGFYTERKQHHKYKFRFNLTLVIAIIEALTIGILLLH